MSDARKATLWLGVLGLVVLGSLVLLAWRSQRVLELGLPPREATARTAEEAMRQAFAWSIEHGGFVFGVLGTGSMAPYLPAGDPAAVVAYVVTAHDATFADVTPGAVCVYRRTDAAVSGIVLHGAALRTADGWVMSGLHNARSDIRMTAENFVGLAARVFVWHP
jgi:hypothetical protein